jgi:hypothetical protein
MIDMKHELQHYFYDNKINRIGMIFNDGYNDLFQQFLPLDLKCLINK